VCPHTCYSSNPADSTHLNVMFDIGILMNLGVYICLFVVYLTTLSVAQTVRGLIKNIRDKIFRETANSIEVTVM
jgi:hypothetical protein